MKEIRSKLRDTVTDFTGSLTNKLSLHSELMVFLNSPFPYVLKFAMHCDSCINKSVNTAVLFQVNY